MATTQLIYDILANDKASKVVDGVGDTFERQNGKFDKWGQVAAGAALAAGAATVKWGIDSVQAYAEAEQSQQQLVDAYERFPSLADVNITKLQELNSELSRKTKFDDDATASGQAVLAQYGLTGQQLADLTPLMQDYAAKTGKDLPTAAGDLGKALMGQGRALKAIGIDFTDTGSTAGNFDQLMAGLRTQVGGFAEGEGTTAAGKAEILKNQFGELQETTGQALMPALLGLADAGLKVVTWIQNNTGLAATLAVTLGVLTGAVALAANWEAIFTTAKTIATAAQWAWNVAMTANPIGLIIVGIAALIAGIVLLVKNWDSVKAAGVAAWGWIKDAWSGAGDWFKGIGESIKNAFKGAFNWVAEKWNGSVGKLSWTVPDWVPGIGGKTLSVPKIPMLAKGGDITAGGAVIVGDGGPEILEVPTGARVTPLNGRPDAGSGKYAGGLHIGTLNTGADVDEIFDELEWRARR